MITITDINPFTFLIGFPILLWVLIQIIKSIIELFSPSAFRTTEEQEETQNFY